MNEAHKFSWDSTNFLLDGRPIQILSGEMHYQRIPHEYWKHRLQLVKAMGLNSVAIYMFWNSHEPKPGVYNFSEMNNVAEFVKTAQEVGLWVILRPGPYCCAEWDFGGLPAWLLKDGNMRVRCMYPPYIQAVERYMRRWAQELVPLQCTRGGPIVMVQVENEYGSYGADKEYLRFINNLLQEVGFEVPLYTCDGPGPDMLENGTIPEILAMVNFGHNPQVGFESLAKFRQNIPHMCCEYYPGWFNHWGNRKLHSTSKVRMMQIAKDLEWMIQNNKSFNLYMFHGGTSFGFSSGANRSDNYKPDITSYDYSSPVTEDGLPNQQFHTYRELIKILKKDQELPSVPAPIPKITIPVIQFSEVALLFENLPQPIKSPQIHAMEYFDQNYGLILYRHDLFQSYGGRKLYLKEVHDYAHIYFDGIFMERYDRGNDPLAIWKWKVPKFESKRKQLDILVEGHGRVNYGAYILDRKGITERVSVNDWNALMNWDIFPIPLDNIFLDTLKFTPIALSTKKAGPRFFRGKFSLEQIGDTFIDCRPWKKGYVWVNGHNIGRFWEIGPQYSLFCPGSWLRKGENTILLFDMEGAATPKAFRKTYKNTQFGELLQMNPSLIEVPPVQGLESMIRK